MDMTLMGAIVSITFALIFYTIGVWWERKDRQLRKIHVLFFCMGLVCDTTGTALMSAIAHQSGEGQSGMLSAHGITGMIAIVLMLFHAIWAICVLVRDREEERKAFHKFSLFVWIVRLIPFMLGMMMGMA